VLLVTLVHLVRRDPLARLDRLDLKDREVFKVKMELLVRQEQLDHKVHKDQLGQQDRLVYRVPKVQQDCKDNKVPLELWETQAFLVLQ